MSTHNICFHSEIRNKLPHLFFYFFVCSGALIKQLDKG